MVFENENECLNWLSQADLNDENTKIIAIMELSEIYEDVHQAIEILGSYSNLSKKKWLSIYDKNCMIY